ncbi:MAG: ROK family glucokinase [Butyricicoccus sp.]
MESYVFGVDIGGTTVKLGLFSAEGVLLDKWEIPSRKENGGAFVLPDIAQSITGKMAEKGLISDQILGIGIDVPGPVDAETTVYRCVNLGWGVFNIRNRMHELLPDIPHIEAANDANVATLGELWQGGGKGRSSAAMFTLGTGVGGGVVIDGKIIAGTGGAAGEVGHITVNPEETVRCNCGKCGCLEQYASAQGIVRMAKVMLAESDEPSGLRAMEDFTAKEICDLARGGEQMAQKIVERCGDYLGRAMSFVACTIDPEVFILGGGMSRAGAVLTDAISKAYQKYAFHVSSDTPIVIATLGNDAGIYGCARMILR